MAAPPIAEAPDRGDQAKRRGPRVNLKALEQLAAPPAAPASERAADFYCDMKICHVIVANRCGQTNRQIIRVGDLTRGVRQSLTAEFIDVPARRDARASGIGVGAPKPAGGLRRADAFGLFARLWRLVEARLRDHRPYYGGQLPRTCPICSYHGVFVGVGHPRRWDARCPNCGSRERHRLMHRWITEYGGDKLAGKRILHFAPEKAIVRRMRDNPLYETADLTQPGVTHTIDITDAGLPDATYDIVIANHVLEHIPDDRKAMRELFRLLRPGGLAVLSVPMNSSRQMTYENHAVVSAPARQAHFGAPDHVRYYGRDFVQRLTEVGFQVTTFRESPEAEIEFGLLRDECLFLARKP